MSDLTQILQAVARGNQQAANELFPLVYDELRRMASRQMSNEDPGQTLQPTALVHEAFLRMVGPANAEGFANRRHFFGAAAEAMRRILVEKARHHGRVKHGFGKQRIELKEDLIVEESQPEDLLAIDESLELLSQHDPLSAEIVNLHFFAGLSLDQIAVMQGVTPRTIFRQWAYARAWLYRCLSDDPPPK